MARSSVAVLLVACLSFTSTLALQVSPNSQCASVCLDDIEGDKSDPKASNTFGSDIVCRDQNYATPVGQKFKKCVDCLQSSSEKSTSESDLEWFLYNIRFAFNSCIYGLANATDPLSSPCSIQTSCGPLVGALQDGMDSPSEGTQYSYCTAFGGSFLGPRLAPCTRCLRLTDDQKYASNFLIALKAGCDQKPQPGRILGLDGTLFSSFPVNSTSAAAPLPTSTEDGSPNKGGLSTGAYAGIGIAGAFVLAIFAAACYIGRRKKLAKQQRDQIASGLDDRWGNGRITVPVQGAYGDPYAPKKSPYQNVGLLPVPSYGEKQLGTHRDSYETHEDYLSGRARPVSTLSHYTTHGARGSGATGNIAPYAPSRRDNHPPGYSPAISQRTTESPSHSPNSIASSTTRLHHAPTKSNASSHFQSDSPSPGYSEGSPLPPAPIVGTGLPKPPPPLPKRSISNATQSSAITSRPGRNTRDLSHARGNGSSISGPIVTVNTRFDQEEEARKKSDRLRLYQQGFQPTKEEQKTASPDGELWPGKY